MNTSRSKRTVGFYAVVALIVLAVVVGGIFAFRFIGDAFSGRDPRAVAGQVEGKSQEEVLAEQNRTVEEGSFDTAIASHITFEDGASEGDFAIENVPGNRYLMKVSISRDDTGDVVYESGIIEPDHHIQRAKLSSDLAAGDYSCTAVFIALDPETQAAVGQAAASVTISIQG